MARSKDPDGQPGAGRPDDPESPERRDALQTIGKVTAASLIAAVAPRIALAEGAPRGTKIDWPTVAATARKAIAAGVDLWTVNAEVAGGQVNGSAVFLPPGALFSDPPFDTSVENALANVAPPDVATGIAGVVWEVWDAWAKSYYAAIPRAFPDLAAVPGPEAADTPLKRTPLRKGKAPGALGISDEVVEQALLELLAEHLTTDDAKKAIRDLARWYWRGFRRWFRRAKLVNLIGSGVVPSFAPPYVPVGPVVAGDISGTAVLEASPFE